jgi:RHS repeat-associated protein
MNSITRKSLGLVLLFGLAANSAVASVGSDNPTGPAGEFEGSGIVTTGGHISTYTANASRSVTDLVVAGGVGAYPLAFTRVSNSRSYVVNDNSGGGQNADFGTAGNWLHSYQWSIDPKSKASGAKPTSFNVNYPDGSGVTFTTSTNGDPYYRGGQGVSDRLQVFWDSSTAGRAYVIRPDGGKVWFSIAITGCGGTCKLYTYTVQGIIDPYGQTTTISGSPQSGLVTITEPGGRWIKLYYFSPSGYVYLIDHLTASDGRSVQYTYTTNPWYDQRLVQVTYYNDPTLVATYTYQADNTGSGGNSLLSTCVDPMYSGPMWKIGYTYATGLNPDNTNVVYGQIRSEDYFDGTNIGAAISTLTVQNSTTRIETRADGKIRTFTYNIVPLLTNWTDFKGNGASQTYDSNGYVTSVTDFNGHTTNFTKNAFTGELLTTMFPSTPADTPPNTPRGVVTYTYGSASCADPNNRDSNNPYYVCTATDEGGHITTYFRDAKRRVTQINYPDSGTETFQYDDVHFGQLAGHTLRAGGTETFTHDARGLLQTYRDSYHATGNPNVWYQYDSLDRVSGTTDTLGSGPGDVNHTTNYTYNSRGGITITTLPVDPNDGQRHTITKGYNLGNGTVTSVTDQLGHMTSFTYDDYKRLLTTTTPPRFNGDAMNHTSSVYYDANGTSNDYTHVNANVTHTTSPGGKKITTVYDENWRKASVTVAVGTSDAATTSFGYDLNGNLTSVVAPKEQPGQQFAGQSTITTYDERNRPYSVKDPLGKVTSCTYDSAGRKNSVTRPTDPTPQVTTFDSFDAMNRLLQSTAKQTPDPDAVTKYTYYTSGLLATMKDPRLVAINSSESYTYQYDSMGRKTSLTYPRPTPSATPTSESWHYDTAGRIDTFTNRNGNTQRTLYDNLNRAYNIAWDDSGLTPTVTLSYDAASRVTAINNANASISHAYFDDGLLSSETNTSADTVARTVSYGYDPDANRASIQYPNNAYSFTYDYTGRNQLWHVLNNNAAVATFAYDLDGNLSTRTPDNSTYSTFAYDGLDRVTNITHTLNGTVRTFDYAYDSVSNRKWTKRDGANGDVFGYDLADQSISILLNVANPDTTSPGAQTINYDANGNRTGFSAYGSTDTYTTNNLNQYTQRNSSTASYDTKGNVITGFDASSYTYDAQSRILTASKGGTTETFKYDGLNRQVSRTIGPLQPVYNAYDGWNLIAEYAPGSTSPSTAYLGSIKNLTANRYYYQDASGSTSHLADNTGHLLEWYRYDLQGTPIFYNASNQQISGTSYGVRHLFTGQQWYSELGVYDLRNRFYSADIGRFVQADPIRFDGDSTNLYRYGGNNPTNRTDPNGLLYGDLTTAEYRYVANTIMGSPVTPYVAAIVIGGVALVTAPEWFPAAGVGLMADPRVQSVLENAGEGAEKVEAAVEWLKSIDGCPDCSPPCPDCQPPSEMQPTAVESEPDSNAPPSANPSGPPAPSFSSGYVFSTGLSGPGTFQMGTYIAGGTPGYLHGTSYGSMGYSIIGVPGTFVTTPSGQTYTTAIGFSMHPMDSDGPAGFTTAVAESAGAGDGGSDRPPMTWIPVQPTRYATAYRWHANPTIIVTNSGGMKGYWQPIAWSTDPSAYVAPPTTTPRGRPIGRPWTTWHPGHGHR